MGPALRHFVEEALGRYSDDIDDWFPGCFHWRGLVATTPRMVATAAGTAWDEDDLEGRALLEQRAERAFVFAHVGSLAVLAAATGPEDDAGETLARLADEPDEGEEGWFATLVAEVLGPVEVYLGGQDESGLDERSERTLALLDLCWPAVSGLMVAEGVFEPPEEHPQGEHVEAVLVGLARVAALLATFRWQSLGRDTPDW